MNIIKFSFTFLLCFLIAQNVYSQDKIRLYDAIQIIKKENNKVKKNILINKSYKICFTDITNEEICVFGAIAAITKQSLILFSDKYIYNINFSDIESIRRKRIFKSKKPNKENNDSENTIYVGGDDLESVVVKIVVAAAVMVVVLPITLMEKTFDASEYAFKPSNPIRLDKIYKKIEQYHEKIIH